jgi:hypothetical protein
MTTILFADSMDFVKMKCVDFLHCECFTYFRLWRLSDRTLQIQVDINIYSHTQHFALQSYITWWLVLAMNVGHNQAIMQELENAYRTSVP